MAFRKVYDSVVQEGRGKRTLTPHAERGSRHLSPRLEACRATPLTGSRRGTTCDSVLFDFKLMKGCETVRLDTVEPVQGAPTWRLSQPGPPARGARAGERWSPELTFSHGWPLSSDAWDGQMLFLAQKGFRVVAHDRRGHGRSSQASSGNDMDGYADDLAGVIEALDLKDATLVGHSTGGGEVARYIGRHGTKRVGKAVLVAAVPPIMLKSATNPEGLPMEVFDK